MSEQAAEERLGWASDIVWVVLYFDPSSPNHRMWPISTRVNKLENDDPLDYRADRIGNGCRLARQG